MDLYMGLCVGGPMDSQESESRFPKGFILADPVGGSVWVYDYEPIPGPTDTAPERGVFRAREVDELDDDRALKAAQEPNYDVRAYDDGSAPAVEVGA